MARGPGRGGRPAAQRERDPASQRRTALAATALAGVAFVVLAVFLAYVYVHEKPLRDGRTVSAQASVLGMQHRRRGADLVQVRFDVPGRGPVEAAIPVRGSYQRGQTVEVRYDPSNPTLVRTARGWVSSWQPATTLVLLVPLGLGAVALRRAVVAERQLTAR